MRAEEGGWCVCVCERECLSRDLLLSRAHNATSIAHLGGKVAAGRALV